MKTTVYLPEDLKDRLAQLARDRGTSEASLIREAVQQLVTAGRPRPHLPLFNSGAGGLAEHVDEELAKGFGLS